MLHSQVEPAMLIDLLKRCGVKMVIRSEGVVHGNSKLLGVFSTKIKGIDSVVSLPQKTDWYEWFTKTEYRNTDEVPITIGPKEARLFIAGSLTWQVEEKKIKKLVN